MGHLIVYIPVPRWHKHLVSQSVPTPSFFGFKTFPVYFLGLKLSLRLKVKTWNHLGNHVFPIVPRWHNQRHGANWQFKKCRLNTKFFIWNFYWAKIVPVLQTRPNSWAKQVREIEWGHLTLDSMTFWLWDEERRRKIRKGKGGKYSLKKKYFFAEKEKA